MELNGFLRVLSRQKFVLIVVPLITVIITYFLVRQLPDAYSSKARIATGLVDDAKKAPANLDFLIPQESTINQQFNNLIQTIQLKKMFDQVSYLLILHDLGDSAFRRPSKLLSQLNKAAKEHAVDVYTKKYQKSESLFLWDADQFGLYRVLVSMGYDEESLRKKIFVYRVSNSDFIDIQFESENPTLSAFIANAITKEFITYYTSIYKENQIRSVNFLDSLQKKRQAAVNDKMLELKNYKIENKILNLNEQARILYGQIADFETKREMAMKDVEAYSGALKNIDKKFDPNERKYLESTTTRINQDILSNTDLLKSLTTEYIKSNYDETIKSRIDSVKSVITSQINQSTDKYIVSPLVNKQNLVSQKMGLEISYDLAKFSQASLQLELDRLNRKFNGLVPHEATVQAYEKAIDNAGKEYLDVLGKYNQSSMEANFTAQLKQIEQAMPGPAAPSKQMLLVILSGVISLSFCVAVIFILFFLDDDMHIARQLAENTGLPVLGFLPLVDRRLLELKKIWNEVQDKHTDESYRNLLRSVRFEVDAEMDSGKILAVTSLRPDEGKTFFSLNLAYAYSMAGKKVLLIDGNFDGPSISNAIRPMGYLEDLLADKLTLQEPDAGSKITVLGNRGEDVSLFELSSENNIRKHLQLLKDIFDVILIESPALSQMGKSKEWIVVSDKTVAVFAAEQSITPSKKLQIQYLRSLQGKFIGWVMNKVKPR
jgi:Mrp family chromosome partitioning ATPase/capsular polysaccharide biosynthesis protein